MGRRARRDLRPVMDCCEARVLLSHVHIAISANGHRGEQKFLAAPTNGTIPLNQLLTPTGVPTAAESRRQTYRATYFGAYTLGPGRFDTEASNFYFRGAGRTTTDLHSDSQLRVIRPVNPALSPGGEISIFTRNLDANTQLGFDVVAVPTSYDNRGRPTHLTMYAVDTNVAAGVYVEATGQGTIDIHYGPVPHTKYPVRPTPGIRNQGPATIVIHAQIYSLGTTFNLRNTDINP